MATTLAADICAASNDIKIENDIVIKSELPEASAPSLINTRSEICLPFMCSSGKTDIKSDTDEQLLQSVNHGPQELPEFADSIKMEPVETEPEAAIDQLSPWADTPGLSRVNHHYTQTHHMRPGGIISQVRQPHQPWPHGGSVVAPVVTRSYSRTYYEYQEWHGMCLETEQRTVRMRGLARGAGTAARFSNQLHNANIASVRTDNQRPK